MKPIFLISLLLLLLACANPSQNEQKSDYRGNKTITIPELQSDAVCIVAVGDMMPATTYPKKYLPPNEGKDLITDLLPYIQAADLAFVNFEGVLSDDTKLKARDCGDSRHCYRFRIPGIYAKRLKEAGFDLLNIACNHINDFGRKGREITEKTLLNEGFYVAGLKERPCISFEQGGIKYGFCAFAPFSGCFGMHNSSALSKKVRELVDSCDIIIVSLHGGAEGSKYRSVPRKDEHFLGFNRGNMYTAAHACIDAGADLIIGTGPHVVRGMELYRNRLIMYSLGNFCTYGLFALNEYTGYGPLMQVYLDPEGKFLEAKIIPSKQIKKGLPRYDSTGVAIKQLQELSQKDFPDSPLKIEPDGRVWIKE